MPETVSVMIKLGLIQWGSLCEVRRGLLNGSIVSMEAGAAAVDTEAELDVSTESYHEHLYNLLPGQPDRSLPHPGLPATVADRFAHDFVARRIVKVIHRMPIAGEEAGDHAWAQVLRRAVEKPGGTAKLFGILDAIDGSGPQDTFGLGYSSNLLLFSSTGDPATARPEMSITVTSEGTLLGWSRGGRVVAAELAGAKRVEDVEVVTLTEPRVGVREVRDRWVAAVAAQPHQREVIRSLLEAESDVTVSTLGGAPVMPALLLYRLHALIVPAPQTRHDASGLLPLAESMGYVFKDLRTGRNYSDEEVQSFFSGIADPSAPPGQYRPIPAMIVARDEAFATTLFARLNSINPMGYDAASGDR